MHIVGREGRVLRDQWGIEPTAYLGIIPTYWSWTKRVDPNDYVLT